MCVSADKVYLEEVLAAKTESETTIRGIKNDLPRLRTSNLPAQSHNRKRHNLGSPRLLGGGL